MIGYKDSKTASKVALSKEDDIIFITKKVYDQNTGAELDDSKTQCPSSSAIQSEIDLLTQRISELTKEKEDWQLLKTDAEAL